MQPCICAPCPAATIKFHVNRSPYNATAGMRVSLPVQSLTVCCRCMLASRALLRNSALSMACPPPCWTSGAQNNAVLVAELELELTGERNFSHDCASRYRSSFRSTALRSIAFLILSLFYAVLIICLSFQLSSYTNLSSLLQSALRLPIVFLLSFNEKWWTPYISSVQLIF